MSNNLIVKKDIVFTITFFTIIAFVFLLLIAESDYYWYGIVFIFIMLQTRFKISTSSLLPIIGILTLTEYYFLFSGKTVYLSELVYIPLLFNYFLTDFFWKPLNKTKIVIVSLFLVIVAFQVLNFAINSNFVSSFFRVRCLALPLFLVCMVEGHVRNKSDLKKIVNLLLFVSIAATVIVYLQFFTGDYYILQKSSTIADDSHFIEGYLSSTEDSFLFNLIGLHIKGPMPPVGLNYFKFGYSEKIVVAASLYFALFKFKVGPKPYKYLALFFFILFATILTGSRSVLLTFLFSSIIIYQFYKKNLKWKFINFMILSVFIVTYFIGPLLSIINLEEFGTLTSRIFYMEDFFKYINTNPLVLLAGNSPESFISQTGSGQPPHHFFAFGVIFDGLFVTLALFLSIYTVLKYTKKLETEDKEIQAIGYGLWACLFGFVFIYGQTSYLTWSIPHNMFFCIIIGLLIATYRINKQQLSNLSIEKEIN